MYGAIGAGGTAPVVLGGREMTAWHAFVGPDSGYDILVSEALDQVTPLAQTEHADDRVTISGLARDDHRRLASMFASEAPEARRQQLSQALEADNYWPAWAEATRDDSEWLKWRFERIHDLFAERAVGAGIPAEKIDRLWDGLLRSRSRVRPPERPAPTATALAGELRMSSLRDLVLAAVSSLGENELRGLWLPVGAVYDAMGRRD